MSEKDIELNAAPATRRHMLDFLAAIDQRSRPVADIEAGHISTASCILANVAMKAGRPLVYDPAKRDGDGRCRGDPAAEAPLPRAVAAPGVEVIGLVEKPASGLPGAWDGLSLSNPI